MNKAMIAAFLGVFLVLAACGDASISAAEETEPPETASPTTVVVVEEEGEEVEVTVAPLPPTTEPPSGVIADVPCEGDSSCVEEFFLNGRNYSTSCRAVREDAILFDEVVGSGTAFALELEVFALADYPNHGVVAVSLEGGICSDDDTDEFVSPWSFASARGVDSGAAVCELGLLSEEQRIVDEC